MSTKSDKRLNDADRYFASIQESQTPHAPRAYGIVAKNVHMNGGSKKEYIQYAKKMLSYDSSRSPKYSDHILGSVASYGLGGAAIGGLIGGRKGAAVGAGLGSLAAGPLARRSALKSEEKSVSVGKKMMSDKDINSKLSDIYDDMNNNKNKGQ